MAGDDLGGGASLDAARAWLAQDPDPETRDELAALLARAESGDTDASADIDSRFSTRLAFGTAGLRGELGAGPTRMNRVLVAQAAAGLAAYLRARETEPCPAVVIGYDGRRNSAVFARDSAEIFAGAGLRTQLLPRPLPTPVLAFAVRYLGTAAGVMVTASHNPPNDNGYKVYLGGPDGGSQIVAPADDEIARHISRIAAESSVASLPRSVGYRMLGDEVVEAYVSATSAVTARAPRVPELRWVYTAMHGVGWETFSRVIDRAGYPRPVTVAEQLEPDPAFPTVAFPNPEEPGAMDLAFARARASGADLVLAHDPDADRLSVGVPADVDGGWRSLTGNEVGLLLGWQAAALARDRGVAPGASLACSLVSSPGLRTIAGHYGLDFHETLTGFKWISRAPGLVFGYEEALGYLVNPNTVRDKDGISAAVALLHIAATAHVAGSSLTERLAELADTFGHFRSAQVSVRFADAARISRVMTSLRATPPTEIAGVRVTRADDLMTGVGELPPGDVLRYTLDDGSRVIVRPSGTEPKLKVYLDVRGNSADDAAARITALESGGRALVERPLV